MTRVLVTGGAGYVGSHTVKRLRQEGIVPVVLDDLSEGHREAVGDAELVVGDAADPAAIDAVYAGGPVDAAIHFAARCYVGESVEKPAYYWRRNHTTTLDLLEAILDRGTEAFLFSSTCAVYGAPDRESLPEDLPREPVNPYGRSKAAVEWTIEDLSRAGPLRAVVLRYFNAAGADPEGELGEDHEPETHLIPLAIGAALGRRTGLSIFGTDYPTPDGTCIRDYIHVTDLADAHVRGIRRLLDGGEGLTANLGTGRGHSVREVIRAVEERTGREVDAEEAPRRPGDPPRLVAAPGRAEEELGWRPKHSSLAEIVDTACTWIEAHPGGYGS